MATLETLETTEMPEGWALDKGATAAPRGYAWANNMKSRFGGEFEQRLVRLPGWSEGKPRETKGD